MHCSSKALLQKLEWRDHNPHLSEESVMNDFKWRHFRGSWHLVVSDGIGNTRSNVSTLFRPKDTPRCLAFKAPSICRSSRISVSNCPIAPNILNKSQSRRQAASTSRLTRGLPQGIVGSLGALWKREFHFTRVGGQPVEISPLERTRRESVHFNQMACVTRYHSE